MTLSARLQTAARSRVVTRNRRGFTLLELIVTLVVLGLLAAIAIPSYQRIVARSENAAAVGAVEGALRNAVALAALEREPYPSIEHVQAAFDELPESAAAGEHASAGGYNVCVYGAESCEVTGTKVEYYAQPFERVVAIVVHGERRILARVAGTSVSAWAQPGGTVFDALAGKSSTVGGDDRLDEGDPTFTEVSATSPDGMYEVYRGVTAATVDVQVSGGIAFIVAMPLDGDGVPLQGGSPHGCGVVTRTVVSGSGFGANCPGDVGYSEWVHGAPHGVVCDTNCRIHLSADEPFAVAAYRIGSEFGGVNYTAQFVASLVG